MKKHILAWAVLTALTASAVAEEFYVVVPFPGKERLITEQAKSITLQLPPYALPSPMVSVPYTFNMAPLLEVMGDPTYSGGGALWAAEEGALPEGLALTHNGVLTGTPVATGLSEFDVTATYKTVEASRPYALSVVAPAEAGYLQGSLGFGELEIGLKADRTVQYVNSGAFTSNGLYAKAPSWPGLSLKETSCGTEAAPVTLPRGATCAITVEWDSSKSNSLSGAKLEVFSSYGKRAEAPFSGRISGFDAMAEWSLVGGGASPLTAASLQWPKQTLNTEQLRTFYLRNVGTIGELGVAFDLSGDTDQFRLVSVSRYSSYLDIRTGDCGSVISETAATTCLAEEKLGAGLYTQKDILVTVAYKPTEVGAHTLTLTPRSGNGTIVPGPITLSGQGEFNPAAAWSSSITTVSALPSGGVTYPITTPGQSLKAVAYLVNTGTHGPLSVGFDLSGDLEHFRVTRVMRGRYYLFVEVSQCGAVIDADSISECLTSDLERGIFVEVAYEPKSLGSHQLTLTPRSTNGTVLPGPLTFSGSAVFNPTGVWSTSRTAQVALGTTTAYPTLTPNSGTAQRTYYLRNTGQAGPLSVGFEASGDVEHFRLVNLRKIDGGYYGNSSSCGTTLNGAEASYCLGQAAELGGQSHLMLTVEYAPKALGAHTLTLTPTTDNGTTLPEPLVLTGSSVYNPAGAWSTSYTTTVAPAASHLQFGSRTQNGAEITRDIYVRNTGTNGPLSLGYQLSGDTDQFRVVHILKMDGYPRTTGCGATASTTEVTPCLADDPSKASYVMHFIRVAYAPTKLGNHSFTLTPYTNNGTALPEPITFTGTGAFNPVAAWSDNYATLVTPDAADKTYGPVKANSGVAERVYYLFNTGTNGNLAVGLNLTGDTEHFYIQAVRKADGYPSLSACGASITATAVSPCVADDAQGVGKPRIFVQVRYAPKAAGTHTLTLTPTTNNGTGLPAPLTLTGSANP